MTNRNSKTKKNNKAIIDTYETIYFVDIVVANRYTTLEQLKKLYCYSDGVELDEEILDGDCTTTLVTRISDNKACCLVKHNHPTRIKGVSKIEDLINTVAHEAGHVVLDIYNHMSQQVCICSSEPFCYLLGYVTVCIYKTITKNEQYRTELYTILRRLFKSKGLV